MPKLIGAEVKGFANLLGRYLDSSMPKSTGYPQLSGPNIFILKFIHDHENEDIFQKDIEKKLMITKSTCSKVLSTMEEKNLIQRVSVNDARYKKIVVTALGDEIRQKADACVSRMEDKLKQGLSNEEIETFFRIIDKMKVNIKED